MSDEEEFFAAAKLGLADLINAFSTAIYVKDREHRCVMLNDACCRVLGRARMAVVGRTDYDFLPKELADANWKKEERVFAGGGELSEEESLPGQNKETRTYTTTKTLFTDRSGRAWLIGVMNDITVHKKLLDDFRFMSSLLEAENEASIAGILIVDGGDRILSSNRRFREMWDIPPKLLETKSDVEALRAVMDKLVDPEGFRRQVRRLYRHRDEKSHDEIRLRDGRIFDRYTAPAIGKDGVYYGRVWHFRDITEIRKLASLQAEVAHRRELDALKDQFIGTVSHELRTPLTIIRSAVDSLRRGAAGELSPDQREVADLCARNILRLSKMIDNLLHISRLESGGAKARLGPVDLRPLLVDLEASFRMMGRGNGKEIRIEIDAPADMPRVRGDPEMIGEVLSNLLDNAARFARSAVLVKVRRERGVAAGRETDGLRVDVIDDGPGIPADRIGRIFDKFYQVERSTGGGGYKGTGLGLAICKEIMTLHGSEIAVDSVPGRGARFHFFLPEWAEHRVRERRAAAGRGKG